MAHATAFPMERNTVNIMLKQANSSHNYLGMPILNGTHGICNPIGQRNTLLRGSMTRLIGRFLDSLSNSFNGKLTLRAKCHTRN